MQKKWNKLVICLQYIIIIIIIITNIIVIVIVIVIVIIIYCGLTFGVLNEMSLLFLPSRYLLGLHLKKQ